MNRHSLLAIALFLLACVVTVSGCSKSQPPSDGSAEIIATTSAALSAADVVAVKITVTGPGITSPIVTTLAKSGASWQGTIGHIPVGSDQLAGAATDVNGTVIYAGQASVTITSGTTAVVALTLQQVNAPPPFANAAPIIDSLVLSTATVAPGGQIAATVTAHDPNGDPITYAWSAGGGSFSTTNTAAVTWTAPATTGPQTLTIQVTDPSGEQAAMSVTIQVTTSSSQGSAAVTVTVNTWPVVANVLATPSRIDVGATTTLALTASDADGDPLSYQWSASCNGTFNDATAAGPTFTLISLPSGNTCTLSVIVSDGRGGLDTGAITISTGAAVVATIAPQVDTSFQSQATAGGGVALTFGVTAHDPQGLALTYAWSANTGTISGEVDGTGSSEVTWTSAACTGASVAPVITTVVHDSAGASTTQTFAVTSTCASCADGVKDGQETDVDCGGPVCGACAIGKGCGVASDCASDVCATSVCQTPTCADGVKNGAETGVDCGGGTCSACGTGGGCAVASDCQSSVCTAGTCQAASCSDGVKDGTETGVDCGGGTCAACGTGGGCSVASDCQSDVCSSHLCVAATCSDGTKNGSETDIDCGGGSCAPCSVGKACVAATDCVSPPNASGACASNVCGLGACTSGFFDCDAVAADGCETASSISNCSACGAACSGGQSCQSETCVNPAWSLVSAVTGTPVSVGIAPNTGGTPYEIYVGTSGNGIFHSADGAAWASTGPASIVSLSSMPQVNASFASLADGSVQTTNNSGASWAATTASPGHVINGWIGIAGVGPLGASSNGGNAIVLQGKSGGTSWVTSNAMGTGVGRGLAFGGGSSPTITVYAAVSGGTVGVYKSTNVGAAAFTFASTTFPQTEALSIATAPTSLSTVFVGTNGEGAGIYVSTDSAATWTAAGTGLGSTVVQALAVDPTNASNVYAGTAAGVYVSKNGGSTWAVSGLSTSSVTSLAVLNGTPTTVYAATSTGLYVTTTGGQ